MPSSSSVDVKHSLKILDLYLDTNHYVSIHEWKDMAIELGNHLRGEEDELPESDAWKERPWTNAEEDK